MLDLSVKLVLDKETTEATNLTDRFSKEDLSKIGKLCWDGYNRDVFSRQKWTKRNEAAMNLALQVQEAKTFPWQGCANVIFPLVTIAALQFSARSYSNIIQGTDVVRYRVVGEDPGGELQKRADRISKHMSWQVLEEDSSWEEQHDRLFINLGIVGTNFIKTYFSPSLGHNVSELVMARDLVMDYYAKSVENCARKTQIIPMFRNEIYERCVRGVFDAEVLDEAWYKAPPVPLQQDQKVDNRQGVTTPPNTTDEDVPFTTLEQHRLLDLDGDGYAEPYIVTLEYSSKRVLRIVARWEDLTDIERAPSGKVLRIKSTEYFTKYSFIPSPDGGIYDVGFGVLLGPLNEAVNSGINQLLDSGTMQNSIGGFLGRGAKIRGGTYTMAPWEWKRVDSTGDDLRKNMVPYPERQPSVVMFQLLNLLINYTDRTSGATDMLLGENPGQNTPAETSRTMVEQGMQIYTTVFKRVWRSMKEEFKKLHSLNARYLRTRERFGADNLEVLKEDYSGNPDLVVPVADPHIISAQQRLQVAMAVRQASAERPGYDQEAVERNFLSALRISNVDQLYKGPEKLPPPPNLQLELEKMKLQVKAQDSQNKLKLGIASLIEQRRLNSAAIAKMEAEIIEMMATLGLERGAQQLQALDLAIRTMQQQDQILAERIQAMDGGNDDGGGEGGVSSVAAGPGNAGVPALPASMAGESEGAMG